MAAWNCGDISHLNKLCPSSRGFCSITGKPHVLLSGNLPGTSTLWTKAAQAYPGKLSEALARALIHSAENRQLSRLHSVYAF